AMTSGSETGAAFSACSGDILAIASSTGGSQAGLDAVSLGVGSSAKNASSSSADERATKAVAGSGEASNSSTGVSSARGCGSASAVIHPLAGCCAGEDAIASIQWGSLDATVGSGLGIGSGAIAGA